MSGVDSGAGVRCRTPAGNGTAWDDALEEFAQSMRGRGRRYVTIKGYQCQLQDLRRVAPADPWAVTSDVVVAWLLSRGASRHHAWVASRAFYAWAVASGHLRVSPVPASARARPGRRPQESRPLPLEWEPAVAAWVARMRGAGQRSRSIETRLTYVRRSPVHRGAGHGAACGCHGDCLSPLARIASLKERGGGKHLWIRRPRFGARPRKSPSPTHRSSWRG